MNLRSCRVKACASIPAKNVRSRPNCEVKNSQNRKVFFKILIGDTTLVVKLTRFFAEVVSGLQDFFESSFGGPEKIAVLLRQHMFDRLPLMEPFKIRLPLISIRFFCRGTF